MSELFDKQVNAQKEKNFRGSHKPLKNCVAMYVLLKSLISAETKKSPIKDV